MSCGLTIVQTQYICYMSMPTMHKRHRHVRHIVVSMQAFAQRKNLERGSCKMRPQLMSGHLVMQPHGVKLLTKRSMWEDHQPDIRLCSTMLLHYRKDILKQEACGRIPVMMKPKVRTLLTPSFVQCTTHLHWIPSKRPNNVRKDFSERKEL
jgi:hypothetical protein